VDKTRVLEKFVEMETHAGQEHLGSQANRGGHWWSQARKNARDKHAFRSTMSRKNE
jgi:hypothetical protein